MHIFNQVYKNMEQNYIKWWGIESFPIKIKKLSLPLSIYHNIQSIWTVKVRKQWIIKDIARILI